MRDKTLASKNKEPGRSFQQAPLAARGEGLLFVRLRDQRSALGSATLHVTASRACICVGRQAACVRLRHHLADLRVSPFEGSATIFI